MSHIYFCYSFFLYDEPLISGSNSELFSGSSLYHLRRYEYVIALVDKTHEMRSAYLFNAGSPAVTSARLWSGYFRTLPMVLVPRKILVR